MCIYSENYVNYEISYQINKFPYYAKQMATKTTKPSHYVDVS
jgi:hypothetical protein